MEFLKAIVLGVVEGITEFLPISSTGHLILVNEWVRFSESFTKLFDVFIQMGAMLAVVFFFAPRLLPIGKNIFQKKEIYSIWKKVILAVFPALILGALLGNYIETTLFNPVTVAIALMFGGLLLLVIEDYRHRSPITSMQSVSYMTAFLIGCFQCLAMIPGTSRSAATIIGAMLLGTSRQVAVEFSFFLAIPTLAAATVYSLHKHGLVMTLHEKLVLLTGFGVSFVVAWIVIAGFMAYISKRDFKGFAYYRILLGLAVLVYFGFLKR
jgi:undecaprenyl-diphosphatase